MSEGHILLIDDEVALLNSLANFLRAAGYTVDTASSGRAGIDKAREGPFDLVLLDMMMPDIHGLEVLKAIKETRPAQEIVVLTGYHVAEGEKKALWMGARDYLRKPVDPVRILMLIAEIKRAPKIVPQKEH